MKSDDAIPQSEVLKQQLGHHGPVRDKIEELILAVHRLTEERDKLLALNSDTAVQR